MTRRQIWACVFGVAIIGALVILFRDGDDREKKIPPRVGQQLSSVPPLVGHERSLLPSLRDPDAIFHLGFQELAEKSGFRNELLLFDAGTGPKMLDPVAKALFLTKEQATQINTALRNGLVEMQKLERDNLSVKSQTDKELVIVIKSFPEQGSAIKNNILSTITKIAGGADEGQGLAQLLEPVLNSRYKGFGSHERLLVGRVTEAGYNEIEEDGTIQGFPFPLSLDSMQRHLFRFEEQK